MSGDCHKEGSDHTEVVPIQRRMHSLWMRQRVFRPPKSVRCRGSKRPHGECLPDWRIKTNNLRTCNTYLCRILFHTTADTSRVQNPSRRPTYLIVLFNRRLNQSKTCCTCSTITVFKTYFSGYISFLTDLGGGGGVLGIHARP